MFPENDLWILPPSTHSHWVERLDWYLNWLICKSSVKLPAQVAPGLKALAYEYDIAVPEITNAGPAPLLVASAGRLPSRKTMILPLAQNADSKSWLNSAQKYAVEMGALDIRVFLPRGVSRAEAQGVWDSAGSSCRAKFTEDQEEDL